jgi:transcriptional regulator with XRE-family HTH domain
MATSAAVQLARRLRALREEADLTQGELAEIFTADGKQVGAAAISSWENARRPALVPENRLEPYGRLRLLRGTPRRLIPVDELTAPQLAVRDELLDELRPLLEQARGGPTLAGAARGAINRTWLFDDGPVVIIAPDAPIDARGSLWEEANPNYTALHWFADVDALIELHGHIRAENDPSLPVFFKRASMVAADDLSGHVVLLGGVGWNAVTGRVLRLLTYLPVRQIVDPEVQTGEIFAVGHGAKERRFLPVWAQSDGNDKPELEEDVGLLARVRNPFNSSRTLTLCNGIHSRGVLGAVRTLTDARIRESNEAYLAQHFPKGEYGLLMRVPVFQGEALSPDLQDPGNILYAWPEEDAPKSRRDNG